MEQKARPGLRWKGCGLGCLGVAGIGGLLLVFTPLGFLAIPASQVWCEWRNGGEYSRNQFRYDEIVARITAMGLKPGSDANFEMSEELDPASLKQISVERIWELGRANETRVIDVRVMPDGRLTVTIRTYSLGHAGVYGLYYSSGAPGQGEVEDALGMGGRVTLAAPNWWAVADYSQ